MRQLEDGISKMVNRLGDANGPHREDVEFYGLDGLMRGDEPDGRY